MGVADIPTKLGPDVLIKTVLPGLIVFIAFFEPIIYPSILDLWNSCESVGDKLLLWVLFGFVIGFFFMVSDVYIYRLFEGRRFWRGPLWKWGYSKMEKYFQGLDEELKKLVEKEKKEREKLSPREAEKLTLRIML